MNLSLKSEVNHHNRMVTHDNTFDISGYHTQIMFTNSMHTKGGHRNQFEKKICIYHDKNTPGQRGHAPSFDNCICLLVA